MLQNYQGLPESAREAYEEALKDYRGLSQANPEVYLPDVAMTLCTLGALNWKQSRPEQVRVALEEALRIYESLAKSNSERFSSDVKDMSELLRELK